MPVRPDAPSLPKILTDQARAIRELQRTRPNAFPVPKIGIWNDGEPQGQAEVIDFIGSGGFAYFAEDGHAIVDISASPATFDAIVDSTLTASDSDQRLFKQVDEALTFLGPTGLNLNRALVLVRPGTYVATANWSPPTTVILFGTASDPSTVSWNVGAFSSTVASCNLTAHNIKFTGTAGTVTSCLGRQMIAFNCTFAHPNIPTSHRWVSTNFYATNSNIENGLRPMAGTVTFLDQCDVQLESSTITLAPEFVGMGLRIYSSGQTWTVGTTSAVIDVIASTTGRSGSSAFGGLTINGADSAAGKSLLLRGNSDLITVTLTGSSWGRVNLYGRFGPVTIPLSTGATVEAALDTFDITGPAVLDITTGSNVTIRGKRVTGHISTSRGSSSGQAVNFVDADESRLDVAATPSSSTGTHKPYAFDASSANNVLVISGRTLFAAAGTDAGTNNRVLPEGAAPPAAGFAPADATYLVTTADATLTNEVPVGATPGGELGGTWASPTVDIAHGWTATRVIYANSSGDLASDAGLTYDDSTNVFTVDKELRVVDGATRYATLSSQLASYGYLHLGIASPSGSNFAVAQGPLGTFINADTGTSLALQIANGSIATISSIGLTMTNAKDIIFSTTTGTKLGTATGQKVAFHNATPVIQRAGAAQAAVATTGATNVTPFGFTTAAQADAIVTLLNELRAALVEKGLIKGSA